MKHRWILLSALALLACCGVPAGEPHVQADLYAARLYVYQGDRLLREQPLEVSCRALPVGVWTIEADAEGYRVHCPWGDYRLEGCGELPDGCPLDVKGPVEDLLTLRPGSRGAGVYRLQQGLRELGYLDEEPSGLYDTRTQAAVCACCPDWLYRPPHAAAGQSTNPSAID